MMTAALYTRVSTEEQALKGFSLRVQQETLIEYCDRNNILISKIFKEDFSAKTFKRPEWDRLMTYIKKHKPDLLLFTRWDRFSRNTGDSYQMINKLKHLGIEPEAIEQPLNTEIPENKLMLALYLASPEIENDRRGLNTKKGMARARKEGRCIGKAPIGYKNKCNPDGKKFIELNEPDATLIAWAFHEMSYGIEPISGIYKQVSEKGLKCTLKNFYRIIRNPIYCGKIAILNTKKNSTEYAKGQHVPIISEQLFNSVQVLIEKKKTPKRCTPIADAESLILRGFLKCPECSKKLTGSASKGRKSHFIYYHCQSPCKVRFNAEKLNLSFSDHLRNFNLSNSGREKALKIFLDKYIEFRKNISVKVRNCKLEVRKSENDLIHARELLLAESIDADDFRAIQETRKRKITAIENELWELNQLRQSINEITNLANQAIINLGKISNNFKKGCVNAKKQIIVTLFPELITYKSNTFITERLNVAAETILSPFQQNQNTMTKEKQPDLTVNCVSMIMGKMVMTNKH
ncbi:MAG: recombinase family protein [Chryseobacterium sp.]|nr:MAG: recombinase family protein [Chryseobacterium sp.]